MTDNGGSPRAGAVLRGQTVAIKAGRSGAMYLWYGGVCLGVVLVSQVLLAMLFASLAVHLAVGVLWLPLLVIGRRSGLFVADDVLTLRMGGLARWSVPLTEVVGVSAATATTLSVPRWAKTQPQRLEITTSSRTLRLPPDWPSYLFSPDPATSASLTASALTEELRAAGATRLVQA